LASSADGRDRRVTPTERAASTVSAEQRASERGNVGSGRSARLPRSLWAVTVTECAVVAWVAVLMFFFPALGRRIWAYSFPPFNSRYVGAVYFAALAALLIVAVSGRWVPGRVVLRMILTFTVAILVVMLFYTGSFAWGRAQTYAFWALYIVLPINTAVFLYRYRSRLRAPATSDGFAMSTGLGGVAIIGLLVGDAVAPAGRGVDFGLAGTWGFLALNAGLALVGAPLVWVARPGKPLPRSQWPSPAMRLIVAAMMSTPNR
jgi:hypothetical protein